MVEFSGLFGWKSRGERNGVDELAQRLFESLPNFWRAGFKLNGDIAVGSLEPKGISDQA